MMMKMITAAIYLCRADVERVMAPLFLQTFANYCSPEHMWTHGRTRVRARAPRWLTQTLFVVHPLARCHNTTFVKPISSRRQRTNDNHTHGSTSCPLYQALPPSNVALCCLVNALLHRHQTPPLRLRVFSQNVKSLTSSRRHVFIHLRQAFECHRQTWLTGMMKKKGFVHQ